MLGVPITCTPYDIPKRLEVIKKLIIKNPESNLVLSGSQSHAFPRIAVEEMKLDMPRKQTGCKKAPHNAVYACDFKIHRHQVQKNHCTSFVPRTVSLRGQLCVRLHHPGFQQPVTHSRSAQDKYNDLPSCCAELWRVAFQPAQRLEQRRDQIRPLC